MSMDACAQCCWAPWLVGRRARRARHRHSHRFSPYPQPLREAGASALLGDGDASLLLAQGQEQDQGAVSAFPVLRENATGSAYVPVTPTLRHEYDDRVREIRQHSPVWPPRVRGSLWQRFWESFHRRRGIRLEATSQRLLQRVMRTNGSASGGTRSGMEGEAGEDILGWDAREEEMQGAQLMSREAVQLVLKKQQQQLQQRQLEPPGFSAT